MLFPNRPSIFLAFFAMLVPTVASVAGESAATRPTDLWAETDQGTKELCEADPSLVQSAVLWLGSEQDGIRIGQASPRLRLAFHAAVKFQMKEAVPWLISIYYDPTADVAARDLAANAAIRIDPYYSQEFLQDVVDDELLPYKSPELLSTAQRAAAVALATFADERARALLIQGLIGYLDAVNTGGPQSGENSHYYLTKDALSRIVDPKLLDRVNSLKPQYPNPPASLRLGDLANQLEANLQRKDLLLIYAQSNKPQDRARRAYAIMALGTIGDVGCVPIIQSVKTQTIAHLRAAAHPATKPAEPDSLPWPAAPAPAEDPADRIVLYVCNNALDQLRERLPIPQPLPIKLRIGHRSIKRTMLDVPDDAELVALAHEGVRSAGGTSVDFAVLPDPQGLLPMYSAMVRDVGVHEAMGAAPYGILARAIFSENRQELLAVRFLLHAPGETAADGYAFLDSRPLKQGQWENTAVILRKYGKEITALIPNRRQADGSWAVDKSMAASLAALKPGQSVRAGLEPGPGTPLLRYFVPYRPPLPAKWVKLTTLTIDGQPHPAAELRVARRLMTCLLPDPQTPLATLDHQTLAGLPAGAPLKVVIDDLDASPCAFTSIRLDGGVARQWDGRVVAIRTGDITYLATREAGWHGTLSLSNSADGPTALLRTGLQQYLASPAAAALAPGVAAKLAELSRVSIAFLALPKDDPLPSLVSDWLAADDSARPELETRMELRLYPISVDASARQEYFRFQVRTLLTPMQYRDAIALGRPFSRRSPGPGAAATTQP